MTQERLEPTARGERVASIDIVRGFALLGILLVNMTAFGAPIQLWFVPLEWWPGPLDQAARLFILFFAQGKFYALFSMLFGLGLTIQMERAEERGVNSAEFIARRLSWLLVIGLAHAFLIWMGDILVLYAVVGFLVIPFRRRRLRTLTIWAIAFLLVPLVIFAIPVFLASVPDDANTSMYEMIESAAAAYSSGDLGRIFEQRVSDVLFIWFFSFLSAPNFLGLFLLGMIAARSRFFLDLPRNLALVRRWIWPLLAAGVSGNAAFVILTHDAPGQTSVLAWIAQVCVTFGAPALALFYVSSILLLVGNERWRRRLGPLAAVGRMALTNYLLQSLICTAIFNGYGWVGLYGQLSTFAGLLLSFSLFFLQIPLSNWWLERFRFGPAEWLWRSLAYRRTQPFRR